MLFGRRSRLVKRILVVEDEALVAFDNEVMASDAGYTVVATVDNVTDALSVLTRQLAPIAEDEEDGERGVDLILTDVALSGQRSGLDLAMEARTLGVPVLFATATPPEGAEELALGVLLKPYNDKRLRAALKAVERLFAGETSIDAPEGVILYTPSVAV